jgi:hypothetical protein
VRKAGERNREVIAVQNSSSESFRNPVEETSSCLGLRRVLISR